MDNVFAWRLSEAIDKATRGGDRIDHGWSILKALEAVGFEVNSRVTVLGMPNHDQRSLNELAGLHRQRDGGGQ